ncbi:hypothetical protein BGZ63DRAFT_405659 [Mariannaea sp. PMI_226]|nr:hypothetical protein BGZ63DRAFT_405659 [Mariannaea sp. PMI_226]
MLLFSILLWIALGPSWAFSYQLQSRALAPSQFRDADPTSPVTDWQNRVTQAFNDARALANLALNAPDDSPHWRVYFGDNSYRDTIRGMIYDLDVQVTLSLPAEEVYRRVIAFIDNPPPTFRIRRFPSRNGALAAARRGDPDTLLVFAELFTEEQTYQNVPIIPRPTHVEMDRAVAQQGPAILHELTHIVTQAADFPWGNINQNFVEVYRNAFRGNGPNPPPVQLMVDDIRPNAFRYNTYDDGMLIQIPHNTEPAYAYEAYTTMRYMAWGGLMTMFNAQNYAAFAVAAMRNGNPTTGMDDLESLSSAWLTFDSTDLDLTLNPLNVRMMRVTAEIWDVYRLIPDVFSKSGLPRAKRMSRMGGRAPLLTRRAGLSSHVDSRDDKSSSIVERHYSRRESMG